MSRTTSKRKDWYKKAKEEGCQFCGAKESDELKLQQAHIIAKAEPKSKNERENIMVLCPDCAHSFDYVIKPWVYRSLDMYYDGKVPDSWKDAEGHLGKKEMALLWSDD